MLKGLIRFHSSNKFDKYSREGKKYKKEKKISKRIYRTIQNIKIINVFLESLLSESFPSLWITVHLTSLGCPPTLCWYLDRQWGQLIFYSGPASVCSCLQCPQLSERVCFLLWKLSMTFHIFHRQCLSNWSHRFNLQLVQLVGRFWVFFLIRTGPVFQLWFYFQLCMWVVHCGLLLRLPWRTWVAPVRARCGGGAAALVAGVLAALGSQGSWQLGQQEI